MSYLKVEDLHKSFGNTKVLNGVSFEIERGEVLAIIGSSGNGKTTLLRVLNCLETFGEGNIYLDNQLFLKGGTSLNEQQLRQNRLKFGLVFQSFNLFPQYNVLKNVLLAPELLNHERIKKLKISREEKKKLIDKVNNENLEYAKDILTRVGLSEKLSNYPCELSGGQQQRVAIARALALRPEVLCFDEPTSALDPALTEDVAKLINSLKLEHRTMIIVTHEMDFAQKIADKVLFMANGIVEKFGTPKEVFESDSSTVKQFLSNGNEE